MSKITLKKFIGFLVTLSITLPFLFIVFWPDQKLYFIACDVGQGDAILLSKGFTQILIDGGPNNKVLDCLEENIPFWDRTIELMINTHQDKDHLAGLIEVVKRYEVKQILSNSFWLETQTFKDFHKQVAEYGIPVYSPQKGEKIKIAGIELKTLWPVKKTGDVGIWRDSSEGVLGETTEKQKTNENSIVLHLQYGNFDAVLTGDITSKEEKQIIEGYKFSDIEVLKIAHHGSKYSTSSEFLKAIKPETAIISVGKNSWGHPTEEVLERLQSIGAQILRTDQGKIKLKI